MQLNLNPEFEAYIDRRLQKGDFNTREELVQSALCRQQIEEEMAYCDWTGEEVEQWIAEAEESVAREGWLTPEQVRDDMQAFKAEFFANQAKHSNC